MGNRNHSGLRSVTLPIVYATLAFAAGILCVYGYTVGAKMPKQVGAFGLGLAALYSPVLLLYRKKPAITVRKTKELASGLIVFSLLFVFTGEGFLRLAYWDGESFGMHYGPLVKRYEKDFVYNRFDGPSRGPEVSGRKEAGVVRILVQGDSITWGQGVKNERDLYTSRVLEGLRSRRTGIEMAVLAEPGRDLDGHLEQLKKWGDELKPDIIVYQWYPNDIELSKRPWRGKGPQLWRRLFFHPYLVQHSYLWYFLDYHLGNLVLSGNEPYHDYLRRQYPQDSPQWGQFVRVFEEWSSLAKSMTPRVIVAMYPPIVFEKGAPPRMSADLQDVYSRVVTLCHERELGVVHLMSRFEDAFDDSVAFWATRYDAHPGVHAHSVIAEALVASLQNTWADMFPRSRQAQYDTRVKTIEPYPDELPALAATPLAAKTSPVTRGP